MAKNKSDNRNQSNAATEAELGADVALDSGVTGPDFGATDMPAGIATNPLQATPAASNGVPVPLNDYVAMVATPFHFKTDKDTEIKGEDGKVVETVKGKKHPSVTIHLPLPKPSRLVEFLTDTTDKFAKERELVQQAVAAIVFQVARGQINDFREKTPTEVVTPSVINYDKLDFTAIANMPKSERGSFVPADEDIKAFLANYLEVMPTATGKSAEKIKNHVDIIATGFKKQRAQKDILEFFNDSFNVYISAAPAEAVEEHADVIEYYQNRLARMLKVEEKITMDDL